MLESVNEQKEEILQKCKQHTCICITAATIHCSVCVLTLFTVCYFYYNNCYFLSDLVMKTKEVLNQNIDNNYLSVVFLQ